MFKIFFAIFLLSLTVVQADDSAILLSPQSMDMYVGDNETIRITLSKYSVETEVTIEFLYDDNANSNQTYIQPLKPIVFFNDTESTQNRSASIIGKKQGHLVLTVRPIGFNVSQNTDFISIDVARNRILNIFVVIVGWIYFAAWSVSFYPQIYSNFKRSSVVGLNFDFLALNILGHSCYSIYNLMFYFSDKVQREYREKNPHSVIPVLLNDVIFSCHAVFACLVTIIQCFIYERNNQTISKTAFAGAMGMIMFLIISTIISILDKLSLLNLIYFFSYVKLAITIIKYCPQAFMNYRRKSTEGWSIGNILLDFTGGTLSILQMFFLSINYDDWGSIFGSPTKFGLGFFSVLFDILFMFQHYVLYRKRSHNSDTECLTEPDS